MNNSLSNIYTINHIISKASFILTVLRGMYKLCDVRTKSISMTSKVISVFHILPLFIIRKVDTVILTL